MLSLAYCFRLHLSMPVLLNVCSFHCRPILPAGLSFKPAEECQLFESFKVIPLFSCQGCAVCYLSCATTSISYHSCLHLSIAFFKKITILFLKIWNGERGIRTLAPVTRPIPLAGAPLRPLEYFSELTFSSIKLSCAVTH